jgi:hypothetical protein
MGYGWGGRREDEQPHFFIVMQVRSQRVGEDSRLLRLSTEEVELI